MNKIVEEGKTLALLSYITFVGTIVAFILNQNKHNPFTAFHIRQAIGLALLYFAIDLVGGMLHLGWITRILSIGVFVLYVIGLIAAAQGEQKTVPFLGDYFQDWFKNLG